MTRNWWKTCEHLRKHPDVSFLAKLWRVSMMYGPTAAKKGAPEGHSTSDDLQALQCVNAKPLLYCATPCKQGLTMQSAHATELAQTCCSAGVHCCSTHPLHTSCSPWIAALLTALLMSTSPAWADTCPSTAGSQHLGFKLHVALNRGLLHVFQCKWHSEQNRALSRTPSWLP